ncbi:carotenoid biosynthesis protein [Gryllotalpicola ginsengisoli]|uniref:carotenoid biosynthesis protein n=1 Tax=Gryllotalpicola ginsengisoli TaxID=444608 RepID=UPI0003B2F8EB|nr:carotenoid biosynthesis protein [Gryllotalpicola ginsengisoli]
MGAFTFVPVWILQDALMLALAVWVFAYIARHERHPVSISIEVGAFALLYAGSYENLATVVGWYQYGRSLLMYFNVPLAVLLMEAMVYYAALKLVDRMAVPAWLKPLGAGCLAVIQDFALDPVETHEIYRTQEGVVGHWTFHTPSTPVSIFGEPVMNFTSWMFLVGAGAAWMMLGRWWHRRSGYNRVVGVVYPILAVFAALATLGSPLSRLVLFARVGYDDAAWTTWPPATNGQWVTLAAAIVLPLVLFAVFWRGRFMTPLDARTDRPLIAVLAGMPLVELVLAIAGGHWDFLWLVAASAAAMLLLVGGVYRAARSAAGSSGRAGTAAPAVVSP